MAVKFLLDTNVVIYLLGGRLKQPLPPGEFGVSVITEIELLSFHALSQADEMAVRDFLDAIRRYPLTDAIRDRTVTLRKQFRLKLPDALIAATALDAGATLLSNDQQFQIVPSLKLRAVELA
jgi:predicted nucleic acid-binding protein